MSSHELEYVLEYAEVSGEAKAFLRKHCRTTKQIEIYLNDPNFYQMVKEDQSQRENRSEDDDREKSA